MAVKKVAGLVTNILHSVAVRRIFGIVGHSLNGITESPRKRCDIDLMHTRHEEVAAFSAGAEVRFTGNLAVRAGSCGPGNLHLINRLYDAHRSGVPVLAIAAHIPTDVQSAGVSYVAASYDRCLGFPRCRLCPGARARSAGEVPLARGTDTSDFPLDRRDRLHSPLCRDSATIQPCTVSMRRGHFRRRIHGAGRVVLPLHDAVFDHLLGKVRLEGGNAPCETIGQCTNDGCDCDQFECNSAGAANAKRAARRRRDKDHNAADH
jgi:hypothetical protein